MSLKKESKTASTMENYRGYTNKLLPNAASLEAQNNMLKDKSDFHAYQRKLKLTGNMQGWSKLLQDNTIEIKSEEDITKLSEELKSLFLHALRHRCVKNKRFSLAAWIEIIKMEIANTEDANNDNELMNSLLTIGNLKQSLKEILHYNNCDLANPDALYLFEDRPRVMIDGKSVRQRRFAILSSKEKNKLPPKSNKNVSSVIIDVLPSTIIRNVKTSIERSTVPPTESSSPVAKRTKPNSIISTTDKQS